jgi:hypothetical protein
MRQYTTNVWLKACLPIYVKELLGKEKRLKQKCVISVRPSCYWLRNKYISEHMCCLVEPVRSNTIQSAVFSNLVAFMYIGLMSVPDSNVTFLPNKHETA